MAFSSTPATKTCRWGSGQARPREQARGVALVKLLTLSNGNARNRRNRIGMDGLRERLATACVDAEQTTRFPLPGPQRRGTGGTLSLIIRGMRPWPPAEFTLSPPTFILQIAANSGLDIRLFSIFCPGMLFLQPASLCQNCGLALRIQSTLASPLPVWEWRLAAKLRSRDSSATADSLWE